MATQSNPQAAAPLPGQDRPVREVHVRNTFIDRLRATLAETISYPFTPSVLILEDDREGPSDETEAVLRN